MNALTKQIPVNYRRNFLTVLVPQSRSAKFENALMVAKSADQFDTWQISRMKCIYIAIFHENLVSLAKAHLLLRFCSTWSGTMCFHHGRPRTPWKMLALLECFLTAAQCDDPRAHCYTDAGIVGSDEHLVVSCRLAVSYSLFEEVGRPRRTRFTTHAPAAFEAQLQAKAVEQGCEICPLFTNKVLLPKALNSPKPINKRFW